MSDVMLVAQIQRLVSAILEGEQQLREEDIVTLFSARGADFDLVCEAAGRILCHVWTVDRTCCFIAMTMTLFPDRLWSRA